MNQNISTVWTKTERVIFRFAFCYLILYFIFLGDSFYVFFPFLEKFHFNVPFQYVSEAFVGFVNHLLIHKEFEENIYKGDGDTSWFFIAIFSYFLLAILATVVWTVLAKRKNYSILFVYLQTCARYYLAFVLFSYGFIKLFGVQFFDPQPTYLMQPLGNIDSHVLLWTFMSASKAYNFFGGLMEIIPAVLLLFRRTSALGSLIAIGTLLNVLMLNLGYDTFIKWLSTHLILLGVLIISPDIKRVFAFFFLKKQTSLKVTEHSAKNKRLRFLLHGLKFLLIANAVFTSIKLAAGAKENYFKPYFGNIDGIYEIEQFYWNQLSLPPVTSDTVRWKKIGINKFGEIAIQYMNDSVESLEMKVDTVTRSLALSSWTDSTFKSNLNYTIITPGNYVFQGTYQNDTIRFSARKIDLQNYTLLKGIGKVKWVWW